jgi:hypothetical protein
MMFSYPPVTCECSATVHCCAACQAHKARYLQPGGLQEAVAEGGPLLARCGTCEKPFPLRVAQQGALTRGQAVYCARCRHGQARARERLQEARRRGRVGA